MGGTKCRIPSHGGPSLMVKGLLETFNLIVETYRCGIETPTILVIGATADAGSSAWLCDACLMLWLGLMLWILKSYVVDVECCLLGGDHVFVVCRGIYVHLNVILHVLINF